jgi:hypothetical protein
MVFHGPWMERERAAMTMWLVGGPEVPPTAITVEPFAALEQLGAFGSEHLDTQSCGSAMVRRLFPVADGGEAVVGELDAAHAVDEQVALAVFTNGVAGIDGAGDFEVDGSLHGPRMLSAQMT